MIRQQVGDVLEISYEGNWFYLVILTKIVMFGGNIVFAYHNDGKKMDFESILKMNDGFNICTDLLMVKRKDLVKRIGKVSDTEKYFKTKYMKGTHQIKRGVKAKRWFIYHIDNLWTHIADVRRLSKKYKKAMDHGTFSFPSVAKKVLQRYLPEQDDRL